VLTIGQVEAVAEAGGSLVLSPNMNVEVIQRTRRLGLHSIPGVATPTEAVGGIESCNAASFLEAGAVGVGVGGWLSKPGRSIEYIRQLAMQLTRSLHAQRPKDAGE
jgi:2-dehydro-3-deoxyphosphogalactonate aldolase